MNKTLKQRLKILKFKIKPKINHINLNKPKVNQKKNEIPKKGYPANCMKPKTKNSE